MKAQMLLVLYSILTIAVGIAFIVSGAIGLRAGSEQDFFYSQVATTFLGVLLSLSETVLTVAVVDYFAKADEDVENIIEQRRQVSVDYPHTRLYKFNLWESLLFFFGVLCLNTSLLCLFWGFTCVISYPTFNNRTYYHFIAVDLVIGYGAPLFLLIGLVMIFKVLQLISQYQFKPESIFASMLIFVDYNTFNGDAWKTYIKTVKGKKEIHSPGFGAWTIVKFFHYPIVELEDDREEIDAIDGGSDTGTKIKYLNCLNWPSWLFGMIITLNLTLCIRFITDATLFKTERGHNLNCGSIADENLDCFLYSVPHTFINCSANLSFTGDMVCHRYYSPNEVDALGTFVKAIFLFITFEKFLQLLFTVMATLYKIRYSKIWALIVLGIGIVMICVSILCYVSYDYFDTGLVFISVFQFTILSIDMFIVGILLLLNKGYYKAGEGKLEKYKALKSSKPKDKEAVRKITDEFDDHTAKINDELLP